MKKLVCAVLFSMFVASPVFANDEKGWYLGFGFGSSHSYSEDATINSGTGSSKQFYFGYRFNPYIAIGSEVGSFGANNAYGGNYGAYALVATGSYPINEKFSVLGKIGRGKSFDMSGYGVDMVTGILNYLFKSNLNSVGQGVADKTTLTENLYGVGVQYNINNKWALRGTYDRYHYNTGAAWPQLNKGTVNNILGSVLYQF